MRTCERNDSWPAWPLFCKTTGARLHSEPLAHCWVIGGRKAVIFDIVLGALSATVDEHLPCTAAAVPEDDDSARAPKLAVLAILSSDIRQLNMALV